MHFEFATASRIIFGAGTVRQVGALSAEFGKRAFVVTGKNPARAQVIFDQLGPSGLESLGFSVAGEPTTTTVEEAADQARQWKAELVIGVGGGSVIDTAKAVAAMMTNSGPLSDYLEVIGKGKPITQAPVPCIAVPTTAGTGAEVTRNSVIRSQANGVKVSLRSRLMLPRIALVDPELTYSMPPAVTAATGLDALTQLIEAYVSNKANPLTDGICREGLARAARSLQRAYEDGTDARAREDMAVASLFGGLALANAKLGAVHGFAGPLGGMTGAPHGVICARLLPYVMQTNVEALLGRAAESPAVRRFDELAQIVTGNFQAKAPEAVAWVQELCAAMDVPSLTEFGLSKQDVLTAVAQAQKSSSMKGNPIELTTGELTQILEKSL